MKELLKALAKFQSEITPISKDANNPFYKSDYASLEHIQTHIKPTLIKCGLIVVQKNITQDNGLFVETKVFHVDSGESESSIFPIIVQKNDSQSYGSAVSYAKRYSLSGILNLTIQDSDDDGENAKQKEPAPTNQNEPTKWLNVLDKEKNFTKEWTNILDGIKNKKIISVNDVRKYYKVSKEVEQKIQEQFK